MNGRVKLDIDDQGIAQVLLTRPERMNALDGEMFDAILETLDRLKSTPGLRVVILSGEGRAFCTGIDLDNFQRILREGHGGVDLGSRSGGSDAALDRRTHGLCNGPQQVVMGWRELPVPVIAVLHGVVFGGGLQLALGADFRFAAEDTRLSVLEVAWGLVPDMAGMVLLRDLVRDDVLRELLYTGSELSAEDALRLGLVSRVCKDPCQEALALAVRIAGQSPDAVRAAKRLANLARDADTGELLLAEAREQQRLLGSLNQLETVRARLERRSPKYAPPA